MLDLLYFAGGKSSALTLPLSSNGTRGQRRVVIALGQSYTTNELLSTLFAFLLCGELRSPSGWIEETFAFSCSALTARPC